jgi:hypothetical protein
MHHLTLEHVLCTTSDPDSGSITQTPQKQMEIPTDRIKPIKHKPEINPFPDIGSESYGQMSGPVASRRYNACQPPLKYSDPGCREHTEDTVMSDFRMVPGYLSGMPVMEQNSPMYRFLVVTSRKFLSTGCMISGRKISFLMSGQMLVPSVYALPGGAAM